MNTKNNSKINTGGSTLIRFDWAMKRLLRQKANRRVTNSIIERRGQNHQYQRKRVG